jgi:hypothetical protein
VLLLLVAIGAVGAVWWGEAERTIAGYVTAALVLFALADVYILRSLPRLHISFGAVAPQLFVLEAPRLAVSAGLAFVSPFAGPVPALASVLVINAVALAALVWGALLEPAELRLSLATLPVDSFPSGAPPLRLLHISDIHVERFGLREASLLELVRRTNPDLVLLTGDYVNLSCVDDPVARAHARQLLAGLCDGVADSGAPRGVFAVLGSPPVDRNSATLFDGLPIRLLRNEAVTVEQGAGRRLRLVGLDCSHDPERDSVQLERVVADVPSGVARVLLYHSPELTHVAADLGIDLYLCGHTHGGQVRLPFYGALVTSSRLGKRYEMGYCREGATHLYVSRGIGFEGLAAPRVRFLCPPEIILWTLTAPD